MPVVYIHGVNTRSPKQGEALEGAFRRWLAPKLAGEFTYFPVYWGDLVEQQYRWKKESRPRTLLRYAGARPWSEQVAAAREATPTLLNLPAADVDDDPILIGAGSGAAATDRARLSSLDEDMRGDVAADLYLLARVAGGLDENDVPPGLAAAAGKVADEWENLVVRSRSDEKNAEEIIRAIEQHLAEDGLIAAGGLEFGARVKEALSRLVSLPGDALSTLAAEGRPAANDFVSDFLGDVLTYLNTRGDAGAPGPIVQRVLDALRAAKNAAERDGQPLIVLTHSMGGQLLLDAVNYYADGDPELDDLQIDHWFTCGSQCSFFAELGLFKEQPATHTPDKLEGPKRVGKWTNFHDLNDFVSFIMVPVFKGVEDIEYNTGCGLIGAHTAYLTRPSFFRLLADRL